MRPRSYRGPLPPPLAAARTRTLRALWSRTPPPTLEIGGFSLLLDPELPDPRPVLGYSPTALLVDGMDPRPGEATLVLDAGSGWVSLAAAHAGASVTSLDPSPAAERCLRRSSLLAGLGDPDVRVGGLEQLTDDDSFGLILWVPPQLADPSAGPDDRHAFAERSRFTRVLKEARDRLGRGGRLLFPLPDRDATPWLHEALTAHGFRFSTSRWVQSPVVGPARLYACWPARDAAPGEVTGGPALAGAAWVLKDR